MQINNPSHTVVKKEIKNALNHFDNLIIEMKFNKGYDPRYDNQFQAVRRSLKYGIELSTHYANEIVTPVKEEDTNGYIIPGRKPRKVRAKAKGTVSREAALEWMNETCETCYKLNSDCICEATELHLSDDDEGLPF